jgi:hypothetical protein
LGAPRSSEWFAVRAPSVTAIFTSGADNPSWPLTEADVAAIRERLIDLAWTDRPVLPRLGQHGYFVDLGEARLTLYAGVITTPDGATFADERDLAGWLDRFVDRREA